MANFPAIRCSSITPTPGVYPGATHITIAGNTKNYQGGNRLTGETLKITFELITSADIVTLRNHWASEQTTGSWLLSTELLDGLEYATEYATKLWQYKGPYKITDITSDQGGVHNAEVEVIAAPIATFIDTLLLIAQPASIAIGSSVRLIGPDTLPTLWVSRLTTAARQPASNGGAKGVIRVGNEGSSFETFWFESASGSAVRVVVVKRDSRGFILWSRWSSAEFGDTVTSRDDFEPEVLPLSDGGCIAVCKTNGAIPSAGGTNIEAAITSMWRLDASGNQVWRQDYTGDIYDPTRIKLNGSEIIILTAAYVYLGPSVGLYRWQPAILRIAVSNGAVLGCNSYRINGTLSSIIPERSDCIFALSSGSIVFKIGAIFVEVNSTGTSVTRCVTFSGSGDVMNGLITTIPDGGYLCRDDSQTLVRLDSSFNIVDRFKHSNAMQTDGKFWGFYTFALSINTGGEGYAISSGFTTGEFFANTIKIVKFNSYGATPIYYNEISCGGGAGNVYGNAVRSIGYDIDLVNEYGFARVVGDAGESNTCRVTAMGFTLMQPTSTAVNTTAAALLDTGSCSNVMGVRGWESPTYSTVTADSITRTVGSATVNSISVTASAGTLNMVDASGSLSWQRTALFA